LLQGEKAYSCTQCGTRFTYRNGLIKHTKLNRCPKKIITPEGETIIKKRSRSFASANKIKQEQQLVNIVTTADNTAAASSICCSPTISGLGLTSPAVHPEGQQTGLLEAIQRQLATKESGKDGIATLFVANQHIQLHANGDTYGLALMEDGSLVATPQQQQQTLQMDQNLTSTPVPESTSQQPLSANVIAALSAATGLPPNEICSWASSLPAGSTVRVTHHFDSAMTSSPPKTPSPMLARPRLQQKLATIEPLLKHQLQERQLLTLEMANACHDSLISACVGLPSYQESFAVDPNEILSKERGCNKVVKTFNIKQEPLDNLQTPMDIVSSMTSTTDQDDLNNNIDDTLSSMISDESFANTCNQDFRPSVINRANSRLLSRHVMIESPVTMIKQEPMFTTTSPTSMSMMASPMSISSSSMSSPPASNSGSLLTSQLLPDLDLDEFPDNILWDDMDLSGFTLNDQDFCSIRSIVEQTFKDGRDVLDIISAV
jgi:DNA-directed RNA polymerase subunit RPC12/RpoP